MKRVFILFTLLLITGSSLSGQEAAPAKPYTLAVRSNLLYDAFLLPMLGVVWRANESVDFNLGLGCNRSEYDSFTTIDGVHVCKDRNKAKNFCDPTQAGISLVWTIGGNK